MNTWMPRVIRKNQETPYFGSLPHPLRPYLWQHSDSSSYGIGAWILHKLPDGLLKAMAHASRSLLIAEKQYFQIETEALGIIFAVTKFHRYLHRRQFILQMDHKPLTIFSSKKGLLVYIPNRLLRWGTILLKYNFKMWFLTSKNICHVDSLSWLIPKNTEIFEDSIIVTLRTNLRNQKQCSQEKSSPSSINSFHGKQSSRKTSHLMRNMSILAIKFFSRPTKNMTFWEVGTIKQRIGELVYIVQGPKNIHKRHMNQLRK